MQTVAENKRSENIISENKTSKAISENYRDTQAGICLRLMTYEAQTDPGLRIPISA